MMRKLLFMLVLLCCTLIAPQASMAVDYSGTPVTIHVNGKYLPCDVDPVIQSGRTLLPVRAAGEMLGAKVDWDNNTRTAILTKDGDVVKFVINSCTYYKNGVAFTLDVPAQICQNRTLIPLRAFAEALDAKVGWNQEMQDVYIAVNDNDPLFVYETPIGGEFGVADKWVRKYYVATYDESNAVGSWYRESTYYGTKYTDYEFLSERNGYYQWISVNVESESQQAITVIKHDVEAKQNQYIRTDDWNILYFEGGPRGWTGWGKTTFIFANDRLIATSYTEMPMSDNGYEFPKTSYCYEEHARF